VLRGDERGGAVTVFLGESGQVELTRSSIDEVFASVVNPSDVNAQRNHFSFDFPQGQLLTGDQLEIKASDKGTLHFITGWGYPDGKWFIHVDEVGSIRLYNEFTDAVAGEGQGRIDLQLPSRNIPIEVRVRNAIPRILGAVTGFELNTSRDAVDVSELGEEFHRQHATMISGNGTLTCFFDYAHDLCEVQTTAGFEPELAVYLHQLVLRQQLGSGFHAKLYLIRRKSGHDIDDELWYEFDALVTNVGVAFAPGDPVRSTIQFVTTGEIKLRVKTVSNLLLQENADRIRLERNQGVGFVGLEQEE
jgi:hypothetical protein